MALTIGHQFVSAVTDSADATRVRPSDWNATHVVSGVLGVANGGTGVSTAATVREVLTADRNYYVRTDGNDSNDGLANTSGGAWLTPQHAMDVIGRTIDFAARSVTVNIGAGSFVGFHNVQTVGGGSLTWSGAGSASTSLTVNSFSFDVISIYEDAGDTLWTVNSVNLFSDDAPHASTCLAIISPVKFDFGADVKFSGVGTLGVVTIQSSEVIITFGANAYTIDRTGASMFTEFQQLSGASELIMSFGTSFTLTGTPSYSRAFCQVTGLGATSNWGDAGAFTGSATGPRYYVTLGSILSTNHGVNYFPGNAVGQLYAGGVYY